MAAVVDRVDAFQQRHRVVGFPLAVVYKFFDDQGNYLAAILTYYAFIAIFPLLLIASSVLGLLLKGNAELRQAVLTSALSQFPIVGTQLGAPQGLQGSVSAVVIGALAALYGVLGVGQAAQNAVNTAWAIPRNSRLNPLVSRLRSFVLMILAGVTVLLVAMLSSASSHLSMFGADVNTGLRLLFTLLSVALNALVISLMMRLATPQRETLRQVLPGGITIAVLWQALQLLGGAYVSRVVSRANDMNAIFAVVLGLLALIYIASVMAVLGVEVNVVLARRLYPRALLTPFTDDVDLTDADRRAYADYAKAQRHKGFQRVRVSFGQRPNGEDRAPTQAEKPDQPPDQDRPQDRPHDRGEQRD
jgi:YihY family inner membrane protein